MLMRRFKKLFSLVMLIMVLVLAACNTEVGTGPGNASGSGTGGELIIGMESEADVMDPHRAGGWVTMRITYQIFEPLIGEDLTKSSDEQPVPELIPVLAEKWEVSEDGKSYLFNLRQGVQFHDGTDFNAEAVKFNLDRLTDENFEYYDQIAASRTFRTWKYYSGAEIIDEHTIKINLSQPFSEFPRMLAQVNSFQIMSPTSIETYGNDKVGDNPAGTGPFRYDGRQRGAHVTLVKNEEYWGEEAKLDKVIFRPLSDPASRVLALQNDEVDIIAVPPSDALENLKAEGFEVITGAPPHVWYLTFNMDNEIMQNKLVRQAINYAIDREGIANELLNGTVTPAYTIQSPGSSNYDKSKKWYEYNPEKAKELLAEAGYAEGFSTVLQTSVDGSGQLIPVDIAEWIQRNLAEVGITVKLDTQEWITYLAAFNDGMTEDVGMNQMSSGRNTPYFLSMVTHSSFSAPGGFNSGKYQNAELDAVLDGAATSLDEVEAMQLWDKAEEMIMEDAALAPVVNDSAPYVVNPRVKGFVVPAEEWYSLAQVELSE